MRPMPSGTSSADLGMFELFRLRAYANVPNPPSNAPAKAIFPSDGDTRLPHSGHKLKPNMPMPGRTKAPPSGAGPPKFRPGGPPKDTEPLNR